VAEYTADFEAGVNGATITTGAGEASATAWNVVAGSPTYSVTHVAHGSLASSFASNNEYLRWTKAFSADHYGRFYLYATSIPSSSQAVVKIEAQTGTNPNNRIEIHNDGIVYIRDNTGGTVSGSVQIATNQWIRIEYHFVASTTVGLLEVRLFNSAESTTPSDTISPGNVNTGNESPTELYIGTEEFGPWGSTIWFDDIVANATSWVGPVAVAPANTVAPVASGSPVVGQILSVTDGTWTGTAPITFTYQWQRDNNGGGVYGDIGGATNNTYTLVLPDLNCNVRAVVTGTNGGGAVPANSNALGPVTNPAPPSGGGQRLSRLVLDTGNKTIVLRG
jgi:hypothetical protein